MLEEKRKYNGILKDELWFKKMIKPVWVILASDKIDLDALIPWLAILPCNFIISWRKIDNLPSNVACLQDWFDLHKTWLDFILTDIESDLEAYLSVWVVPIISSGAIINYDIEEFNPLSNVWNSFLFWDSSHWGMYYALVKYLENFKFPYDNKTLVKNVLETVMEFEEE